MSEKKLKINYVELTGNLASDARVIDEVIYITIATWNGKDKEGQERPATFTDVAFFNKKDPSELIKGQKVHIKGHLANYKDKETHYNKLGVVGLSLKVLHKEADLNTLSENNVDDTMQGEI